MSATKTPGDEVRDALKAFLAIADAERWGERLGDHPMREAVRRHGHAALSPPAQDGGEADGQAVATELEARLSDLIQAIMGLVGDLPDAIVERCATSIERVCTAADRLSSDEIDAVRAALTPMSSGDCGAGWRDISTCPRAPTDETWRILAFKPNGRRQVEELRRHQEYEGAGWNWTTPPGVSGRGYIVLWEAITHWMPLPSSPAPKEVKP